VLLTETKLAQCYPLLFFIPDCIPHSFQSETTKEKEEKTTAFHSMPAAFRFSCCRDWV
jgi:hypothetical protein